jgi:nicotinamidase-related amidase
MPLANTALVVIDVQRGIVDLPGLARRKEIEQALNETVARIAGLIGASRVASVPVIYVQHDGGPGDRLEPEAPGWPLRDEIAPQSGEPVIRKRACDAFFETPLDAKLRAAGIEQIVICGCMTQYCIDTSVRRAVSLGYDVILASDGHTTADTRALHLEQIVAHHNALLDGFEAGEHEVRVRPSSRIVAELGP